MEVSSFAQSSCVLIIADEIATPLAFAHVENVSRGIYKLADDKGLVTIIDDSLFRNDTFVITHLGYAPYTLFGLGSKDTCFVFLVPEPIVLEEVPLVPNSFSKKAKYRVRCTANYYHGFETGQAFSQKLDLHHKQLKVNRLKIYGRGDWDSISVRISILDTFDYARHVANGHIYTLHQRSILLEKLNIISTNEAGIYFLTFEVLAFYGSTSNKLMIPGCSPEKSELIGIKGDVQYPNGFKLSRWYLFPWQPKIEVGYSYN